MRVTNAAGRVVLDTVPQDATIARDPDRAYTALGVTHREQVLRSPIIEGWDHVAANDDPWHRTTEVLSASATDTTASLDLVDPSDRSVVLHVELAVRGTELRFDARVGTTTADGGTGMDAGAQRVLNELGQAFVLADDEHFFGLGERNATVDHRGQHFQCWVEEGGLGLGENPPAGATAPAPNGPGMTSIPIPFLLSTRGYGVWIDTERRTGFSMGADDPHAWRFYAVDDALHYRVFVHDDPRATIADFTAATGRATLPAAWVFGPRRRVDHGNLVGGEPEELALRSHHVPTTMVDDTTHFLPTNGSVGRETFLRDWTAQMHVQGFKTIGYFNTYVSLSDMRAMSLVEYGRAHDLFVRLTNGNEFVSSVVSAGSQQILTIDLTNPDAVVWYRSLLQQALDMGYDGWMQDFGEYISPNVRMHDGRTGWEAHNAYPVISQRVVFDYLREQRGNDFQFWVRSGYTGTQSVTPMIWSGDPSASFDDTGGIPGTLRSALNAGISGLPYWGSDISGYTCLHDPPADKEVYLRWAELGAFSPDMHDENACAAAPPGSPPKWTLWSDAETTTVYGDYARLHTRMIPYLYAAAREASETGMPIMRHPILIHPDRIETFAVDAEYYFGPALYVAPVVRRGQVSRTFWLPPGQWFDWNTLEAVTGGASVTRSAPLVTIPVLLRSGGIVALLDPRVETLAPDDSPSVFSMNDLAGIYDVRAAIGGDVTRGRAELVDGTVFDMSLGAGTVTLPVDVPVAATEADLATCARCGRIDTLAGGVLRVRVSLAASLDAAVTLGALALHHHSPTALQARWDMAVRPQ